MKHNDVEKNVKEKHLSNQKICTHYFLKGIFVLTFYYRNVIF